MDRVTKGPGKIAISNVQSTSGLFYTACCAVERAAKGKQRNKSVLIS
jgi:hypothetical protein